MISLFPRVRLNTFNESIMSMEMGRLNENFQRGGLCRLNIARKLLVIQQACK